ncbi:hypothetical protein R3P38DRAFT_3363224 [Favolaschia claudopus]|uniref:MYND-type domain-containing protein n=1 Tax=Favolaschia claudopus TaxID=2862362 RepID=A0AAW0AJ76_9AGAR
MTSYSQRLIVTKGTSKLAVNGKLKKTIAMEMICSCPSADTITRFVESVSLRDAMDFLPVFFYSLDDSRIPTPDDLENWNPDTICILVSALASFLFVLREKTPVCAAADLWPRVWAWMQFFWTYDEFLRCLPFHLLPQEDLHADMLRFCEHMFAHPPNKVLFTSTPGFAVFVTRAWSLIAGSRPDKIPQIWEVGSAEMGGRKSPSPPIVFNDANWDGNRQKQLGPVRTKNKFWGPNASGQKLANQSTSGPSLQRDKPGSWAGGTINNLAQLCMREVKLAVPDTTREGPLILENMGPLEAVLNFLIVIDNHNRDTSPTFAENPLCRALIPLGVVEPLTYAANMLIHHSSIRNGTRARVFEDLIKRCLIVFEMFFRGPGGHRTLHIAVRFGLLNIMHVSSQWKLDDSDVLDQALLALLAMYYNSLPDLTQAYHEIAMKEIRGSAFASSLVFEAWQRFGEAVQWRFSLLNYFNSEEYEAHRACDNIECGTILEKRMLKRCTGCNELLYCSRQCQVEDWRAGHRRSCASHQAYHRKKEDAHRYSGMRRLYTRKEYSFFRCILHHDMASQAPETAHHYIEAWSKSPGAIIATISDYRVFPPDLGWADATGTPFEGTDIPGYWNDLVSRARRSCGRLDLNIMGLDDEFAGALMR